MLIDSHAAIADDTDAPPFENLKENLVGFMGKCRRASLRDRANYHGFSNTVRVNNVALRISHKDFETALWL
ncbi:MAG TPA: hypothetical protein VEB19_01490 [Gemmatimonadaceae bacterium]|nr:hypothetical protein [Gemmatimonadaceae bacterium]